VLIIALPFAISLLVACGSTADTGGFDPAQCSDLSPGDAAAGEVVFLNTLESSGGRAPQCVACHAIDNDDIAVVGPGVQNIGAIAGSRVPDQSAEEYLCRAIVAPQEFVVPGYSEDAIIMPITYGQYLTEQQIRDLVAYMLTLEDNGDDAAGATR
jgi:mono/diheme cytochrome c family protein